MNPALSTSLSLNQAMPATRENWRRFNSLGRFERLRHRYLAQRHGPTRESLEEIYISAEEANLYTSQVLPAGRSIVRGKVEQAASAGLLDRDTIIVCSDYIRTMQSALIAAEALGSRQVILTPMLRERHCGELRGKWEKSFPRLSKLDRIDPEHCIWGVESVCAVTQRLSSLVEELEQRYPDSSETFLFASHCEVIQIGASTFALEHPGHYSDFGMIDNGDIVLYELNKGGTSVQCMQGFTSW